MRRAEAAPRPTRGRVRQPGRPRGIRRVLGSIHVLLLGGVLAVVDWQLHRDLRVALGIAGAALLGLLAAPALGRLGSRLGLSRRPWLRVLLAVVPLAAGLVLRWRGAATVPTALLTAAVPAVAAGTLAWVGRRGAPALAPIARVRNRVLPRWLRAVAAGTLPVVLTFWLVHGSLADIGAIIGLTPAQQTPLEGTTGRTLLAGAAASLLVLMLLDEPSRRARRAGRARARAPGPTPGPARARSAPRRGAALILLAVGIAGTAWLGAGIVQAGGAVAAPAQRADVYGDEVCPPGFHWVRMSANGCVQTTLPAHGSLNYTQEGICREEDYSHAITESRKTPTGEPIPGSGGKTALTYLLACLSDAEYEAYLAQQTPTDQPTATEPGFDVQGGTTLDTPSSAANVAWVVGGGSVAAAALIAAAAAAGWAPTREATSLDSERCHELTARRAALVARYAPLAQLAGQRQGTIGLIAQTRAGPLPSPSFEPGQTPPGRAFAATSYGTGLAGALTSGAGRLPDAARWARGLRRPLELGVTKGPAALGAAATFASNYSTQRQSDAAEQSAYTGEAAYLARLEAQRYAAAVDRLERYRSWLENRLIPQVDALRADVQAYNADVAAMGTLEGWICPATALDLGPIDALLADAPPEGYQAAPTGDDEAPSGLGHDRPDYEPARPGGCGSYAEDLRRFNSRAAQVAQTVARLDDEARIWGQRVADADASARPVLDEFLALARSYGLTTDLYAAGTATSVASGVAPLLVAVTPVTALAAGTVSLLASAITDLAFTPSQADAARLGALHARVRFLQNRVRYFQAEYEQRAKDRRRALQNLHAEYDELRARYESCSQVWAQSGRTLGPPPVEPPFGHAPARFTPTVRSLEELASW